MAEHKTHTPPVEKPEKPGNEPLTKKMKRTISDLPQKKQYIELLTALLSVPLMITVLLLNLGNLRQNKKEEPTPTPIISISEPSQAPQPTTQGNPTVATTANPSNPVCIKEVGPVEISSPEDQSIITESPVCIEIKRPSGNYCEVAWSYRINNDPWSSYTDSTVCLYSLTPGEKQLEVKVKSIASSDETTLKRSYTVLSNEPTSSATSSAVQQ